MNTLKLSGIVATSILVFGSVPTIVQHSRAKEIRAELDLLAGESRSSELQSSTQVLSGQGTKPTPLTPAEAFLGKAIVIGDIESFIERIATAQMRNDILGLASALAAISQLSEQELEKLIADVAASGATERSKQIAQGLLVQLAGMREETSETVFDEALASRGTIRGLESALSKFAKEDPQGALRWYYSRRDDGTLDGKGTRTPQTKNVIEAMVTGFAFSDPPAGQKMIDDLGGKDRQEAEEIFVGALISSEIGREFADSYLADESDPEVRGQLAKVAAVRAVNRGLDLDAAAAFLWENDIPERHRSAALSSLVRNAGEMTMEQQGNWLAEQVRPGAIGALDSFVRSNLEERPQELGAWVEALPDGIARDRVHFAEGRTYLLKKDFAIALNRIDQIDDAELREDQQERILNFWSDDDPAAARAAAEERGIDLN